MSRKVLVLYGSPKGERGASANIVGHVLEGIQQRGRVITSLSIYKSIDQQDAVDRLVRAFDDADDVVLTFPLYIDTLPAGVSEALTGLFQSKERISEKLRRFLAICNCGFPESHQCQFALRSCQLFAERMGMEFWGGVAIGQGGMLGGGTSQVGRVGKKQMDALRSIGSALADGTALPGDAVDLLARPNVPPRMFTFFGNRGWNAAAKKNGVRQNVKARPYLRR